MKSSLSEINYYSPLMPSLLDQIEFSNSNLITVDEGGEIVAVLEYDWVQTATEMFQVDRGERAMGGQVLYISNLRVAPDHPEAIWKLRKLLPPHRYIAGLTEQWELKAPRGLPDGFLS